MATNDSKEFKNVLEYNFFLTDFEKKGRDFILKEILKRVCALLNSDGGELILIVNDSTGEASRINSDSIVRPIEQHLKSVLVTHELQKGLVVLEVENKIILIISGLSRLCTVKTNLFLPTNTEILMVPATENDTQRKILFERRVAEISEQTIPEQFYLGRDCGFRESKTVQFKQLKTDKTKNKNFASRIIGNKFQDYISGFANSSGGQIFYGVNDSRVVVGQKFNDVGSEQENLKGKLQKAIQKMIWAGNSSEIKCGEQWDIKFVPVINDVNEIIQSTFVVVISVRPFIGGVFTAEPESYCVENGEVKKMPFDSWRENMYVKIEEPKVFERTSWVKRNEKEYMKVTEHLGRLRQVGKWMQIEEYCRDSKNASVNVQLIVLFQLTAVKYRQGDLEAAKKYLDEFHERSFKDDVQDKTICDLEGRYSAQAIKGSCGKYEEAWSIIEGGFPVADIVPAGFLLASYYSNAASVLSNLVHDKSFIGVSKDNKDFKKKVCDRIKLAIKYCVLALQHLLYINDEFEMAKEDLRQKIHIAWAHLLLRSADKDASVSDSDIESATLHINEVEKSFLKVKANLKFNYCRLLLVKSDLLLRKYQLTKPDVFSEIVFSKQFAEEALELSDRYTFKEIKMDCVSRRETLQKIIDEGEQTNEEDGSSTDTED